MEKIDDDGVLVYIAPTKALVNQIGAAARPCTVRLIAPLAAGANASRGGRTTATGLGRPFSG